MKEWKDDVDYSTKEIKGAELKAGPFRLSVHHYVHCGDTWFASCPGIFSCFELASNDIGSAKIQAKAKLHILLQGAIDDLIGTKGVKS